MAPIDPTYSNRQRHVLDRLEAAGPVGRYRLFLHAAIDDWRLLPMLIGFVFLPIGVGALVEAHLGAWATVVVFGVYIPTTWLFLKGLRWVGVHRLTVSSLRGET